VRAYAAARPAGQGRSGAASGGGNGQHTLAAATAAAVAGGSVLSGRRWRRRSGGVEGGGGGEAGGCVSVFDSGWASPPPLKRPRTVRVFIGRRGLAVPPPQLITTTLASDLQ
jgi:hypothetical protein